MVRSERNTRSVHIVGVRSVRARSASISIIDITFSRFDYVTRITRISPVSITHTTRKLLENQRSNARSNVTKKSDTNARTQVRSDVLALLSPQQMSTCQKTSQASGTRCNNVRDRAERERYGRTVHVERSYRRQHDDSISCCDVLFWISDHFANSCSECVGKFLGRQMVVPSILLDSNRVLVGNFQAHGQVLSVSHHSSLRGCTHDVRKLLHLFQQW